MRLPGLDFIIQYGSKMLETLRPDLATHSPSPSRMTMGNRHSVTSKLNIIPLSWCSAM
jgi:hypothetical protein